MRELAIIYASEDACRGQGHTYRATALLNAVQSKDVRCIAVGVVQGSDSDKILNASAAPVPTVWDVPDDWTVPSGCIRITEVGDVVFPNGERLEGLEYTCLRPQFREARLEAPRALVTPIQRVAVHHAAPAVAVPGGVEVARLANETPWLTMLTADQVITYPSMTALEALCLGVPVHLLPPRTPGEEELDRRIRATPDPFGVIDGLGARRIADAILNSR